MEGRSEEERFSAVSFAGAFADQRDKPGRAYAASVARRPEYRQVAEDVRRMLVQPGGGSPGDRERHTEMLNRAVLGHAAERSQVLAVIQDYLVQRRLQDIEPPDPRYGNAAEAIFADVIGLDVLELILKNPRGLEEIQVVGRRIFELRDGRIRPSGYSFDSVRDVERLQQNLVLYNQDSFNPRKRWAEVMLRDGSRVTMTGFGYTSEPTLTVRFFHHRRFRLLDLCRGKEAAMDERTADLLRALLEASFNLVVIGPTNSGKTHLIKSLIAELPDDERIVTIESRRELMLKRDFPDKNVIEYEIDEGDPRHDAGQAFKLALRQTPKRIIHAEIRDDDANIYVRACTRGHQGSMTTVHVNELEDVPEAIAEMCMQDGRAMNPDLLIRRICRYVTQIGIELAIVGGKRKVVRVGEFVYDAGPRVRDIVRYDREGDVWAEGEPLSPEAIARIRKLAPAQCAKIKGREAVLS